MLFRNGVLLSGGLLLGSACVAPDEVGQDDGAEVPERFEVGLAQQSASFPERQQTCLNDPRVVAGVVSQDLCIGADLFFRETFDGNGRSCGTCHPADNDMALGPEQIAQISPFDPLFVAEFNPVLAGLEVPAAMRRFGLILENVDGFAPDPRVRFTLRSIPHTLSMGVSVTRNAGDTVTPPIERTGWSGDGAPGQGGLRDFQTGAITQHYTKNLARVVGRDFRLANDQELDRIDLFMRQFGRTNEITVANIVMTDAAAELGRQRFIAVGCNGCHNNAGANVAAGGNRNFNTGVETARHAALARFPLDGGFLATPANADGSFGNGAFNTPPLVEAADTGPFFHTATTISGASAHNAAVADTIEQATAFYDTPAFNNSPSGLVAPIDLTAADIDNIGRFLRGVNATFNVALAQKRVDAALALVNRFHQTQLFYQRETLRLANVEINDAITVLSAVGSLNTSAQSALRDARARINDAISTSSESTRVAAINVARSALAVVSARIGTNLSYTIGAGTVLF